MAQSAARQWPALPEATPQSLALWARQITRLLQEGAIIDGLGPGDVIGPASAGDSNVPLFDGATGKLLKDSGFPLSASGNRYGVIPFVANDGVMELGRYLDFHNSDGDTGDAANRLETNGGIVGLFEAPNLGALKRIVSLINSSLANGDLVYFDGTNFVRRAIGSTGQFLRVASGVPTWETVSQVVTAVAQGSLSAVATLDIALGSANMYEIDLINIAPATDAQEFFARFSQSGSFLSGAADYNWNIVTNGASVTDASDSEMRIADNCGNAANELTTVTLRIFRPSVGSFAKTMIWHGRSVTATPTLIETSGGGQLIANTNAIDGVRFMYTSGNIASGYYAVRSYSFT